MQPGAIKLFLTQSPRHFEGGDWDQGGSCQRLQPLLAEQVSLFLLLLLFTSYIEHYNWLI